MVMAGKGIKSMGVSVGWNTVTTGELQYLFHKARIIKTQPIPETRNAPSQNALLNKKVLI